jgi:hypothetical protein
MRFRQLGLFNLASLTPFAPELLKVDRTHIPIFCMQLLGEQLLHKEGAALAGARAPGLNRAIGFGQPNLGIKP